jgi:hypothetical protein
MNCSNRVKVPARLGFLVFVLRHGLTMAHRVRRERYLNRH